jgi:predicted N-acyltransferase
MCGLKLFLAWFSQARDLGAKFAHEAGRPGATPGKGKVVAVAADLGYSMAHLPLGWSQSGPALRPPDGQGPYSISLAHSIDERDADEWLAACGGRADAVMDPRFLRAVENSMGSEARFYNVVVSDAAANPVAAAFLSLYSIDGLLLAPEGWKKAVARLRWLWPSFLKVQVLFCGCPVSTGESHLRITPGGDPQAVLSQLDRLLIRLARTEGTQFIVFKEFGPKEAVLMDNLTALGYARADSLPMNGFPARFRDFNHVCASFRSRYRNQLLRSRKKFERSGLRVEHLRGGMGVEALYTEDVHRLYLAVLNRAEVKLECLPAEFFRELARQFPEDAAFTLIYQDKRLVAFMCGIFHQGAYLNLFCGFDYELNDETDLYFNLMYEDLDYALRQNVQAIHVGQTANDFKSRMGCFLEPRCFYVKARLSALQPLLRAGGPHLFPPASLIPERNLFREAPGD